MIIMIIIIIFLVLALTIPTGNGACRPRDCGYFGSGASPNPQKPKMVNAAPAVRFGTDGFLEASGLGQKFPTYETGKIDGKKLGYNRDLGVVQSSNGHDFPLIMLHSPETLEITKQGMKPSRNQIFVNRIDMNPGTCAGVPNDIYMSAIFGEDDDSILMPTQRSGRSHKPMETNTNALIHMITDEHVAKKIIENHDKKDKIVVVASHGCGACRGLMQDLHQSAEKDHQVKQKLMSGHVHFIEAGTFAKSHGDKKFGQVTGIPTIFHVGKDGQVHKKIVGKRPAREVLGL
jgi:hypothetical protein